MLFCQTNYLVIVLTEGTIYVVLNFLTTKCSVNWVTIVHCFACNCFLLFKSFWGHDDWARGSFTTYGNCTLFWPDRGRGVPEPWWAGKSSKPTCFTRFDSGLWFFFSIFHNVYLSLRTWGVWKWKGNFFFLHRNTSTSATREKRTKINMLGVVKNWVIELLLPGSILQLKHIFPLFAGPPKRRRRHPKYLKRGKPNLVVIPKGKIILGPMTKLWADSLFLQISWGECTSASVNRLASSVTRVVICVSRAFCQTDYE